MLFYESERSDQHNYLYCQRDHNFNFPAHLHHSFEFLCVQSGTLACTLETEQYEVHPGEALLVLPDQIHSYRTIGESQSVLWVFSTDWVPEFISQLGQREFITPVFRMEAAPLMELLWPGGNRCKQLAGLYLICGAALEQCFLQPRPVPDVDAHLSSKIIDYVQKNYTHTLTLEQMARDLGYNYTYLSAYFNHSLHTGFQGFINQYRISHAAALLQGSSLPITQVAEQCGFGTIRSFNRVFLKRKRHDPQRFPQAECAVAILIDSPAGHVIAVDPFRLSSSLKNRHRPGWRFLLFPLNPA